MTGKLRQGEKPLAEFFIVQCCGFIIRLLRGGVTGWSASLSPSDIVVYSSKAHEPATNPSK